MGYRERNREKMEKIYRDYESDVYRVSLFFLKDEQAAFDVTQQVFFKFYQHIDEAEIESVRGYLVRMARNMSFNYLRDQKHEEARASMETIDEEAAMILSVEEIFLRGEQTRQRNELSRNILERLRQENENWYTAVNLLFCLGKSHEVVADEMGISKDALYSMIYRARKWIYKNYIEEYNEIRR